VEWWSAPPGVDRTLPRLDGIGRNFHPGSSLLDFIPFSLYFLVLGVHTTLLNQLSTWDSLYRPRNRPIAPLSHTSTPRLFSCSNRRSPIQTTPSASLTMSSRVFVSLLARTGWKDLPQSTTLAESQSDAIFHHQVRVFLSFVCILVKTKQTNIFTEF